GSKGQPLMAVKIMLLEASVLHLKFCNLLQKSFSLKEIEKQGRTTIMDTIQEIEERHNTVINIQRSLNKIHQVFLDMAALVQQLHLAWKRHKNTRNRKCTFIAIII
ncbi:hypothetical protein S83_040322, partial [Arachis hypogaea]